MNDIESLDRQHDPPVDLKAPPKHGVDGQSRWGGRLFALGAFLLLAGGLALGASRYYAQYREVMATAEQIRDFVLDVRVATVRASPNTIVVTLPATTAAFADANIYARATGYIESAMSTSAITSSQEICSCSLRYRNSTIRFSQNEATLVQLRAALQQAEANRNWRG